MFYSKQTGGFYSVEINGDNIPQDAVEVTTDHHAALLAGQSAGQRIVPDENGFPVLANRLAQTEEQIAAKVRAERNALLSACDWMVLSDAPLTELQKSSGVTYRQLLRDVPDQVGFPQNITWPSEP